MATKIPSKEDMEQYRRDYEAFRLATEKALIDGTPLPSPPPLPIMKVQAGKPASDLLKKIGDQATTASQNAPASPQLGPAFTAGSQSQDDPYALAREALVKYRTMLNSGGEPERKPPEFPELPKGFAWKDPTISTGPPLPDPRNEQLLPNAKTEAAFPWMERETAPDIALEKSRTTNPPTPDVTTNNVVTQAAPLPSVIPFAPDEPEKKASDAIPLAPRRFEAIPFASDKSQSESPVIPFAPDTPAGAYETAPDESELPKGYKVMSRKKEDRLQWEAEDEAANKGETALPRGYKPKGPPPMAELLPASHGMSLEKGLEPIKNLIQKITEQMDFDQPKYANANAPLTANLQSNLGSLPFVGQLAGAFTPLIRFSEALSQSYAIQKQNMDRYNIALAEHERKLKAEFKAQGMSDTDAGDLAKRQTKMIKDQGIGLPGAPAPSADGAAGAGGTGAMSTALAAAGALGMVASTAMAASQAFQAVVSTARRYVEVLSPATVFALDRAQRDLTATIGVALLPIISVATGVLREFASVLLPITQRIQPIVQRIAEMTSGMLSKAFDWFGKTADALMPLVEAGMALVEAFAPLVDASIAISGVMLDMLKPVIVIVSAAIQAIAIPIKMMADGIAAFTPLFTAFGAVISGLAEMMKSVFSSIVGALGLGDITDAGKQLKGVFEAIAIAGLKAVAMFAKWMGGDAFIAGMIKSLAPPDRESAVGMAVIQNPAVTSLQEWSRKVATQSLLAGPGGDAQKRTSEQWLEDAVKSLKEIQTGQGDTITGAITRWWKDNGPSIVKLITETLRSGATESTYSTAGWLAERAAAAGKYGTAGAILGPVGAAIGSTYGAIRGE